MDKVNKISSNKDQSDKYFHRYFHQYKPSKIPSITRRRLLFTYRTVYTTSICLVLTYYYQWGSVSTYLSPVISAISTVLYLGDYMKNLPYVFYGGILGSSIGVIIGFTYHYPSLQLTLLFFAIVYINRRVEWDQIGKVLGGLTIVLASLWPVITNGEVIGSTAFTTALQLVFYPIMISAFTLLFPLPALAIQAAKMKSRVVCHELSSITMVLVRGFIAQDIQDLCSADFDHLYRSAEEGIHMLGTLTHSAQYEVLVFPWLEDRVEALTVFQSKAILLLDELSGLRDMLKNIQNNQTQSKFVESMALYLEDVTAEITVALRLISEEITVFDTPESIIWKLPGKFFNKMMRWMMCDPSANDTPCCYRTRPSDKDYDGDSRDINNYTNHQSESKMVEDHDDSCKHSKSQAERSMRSMRSWRWESSTVLIDNRKRELQRRSSESTRVNLSLHKLNQDDVSYRSADNDRSLQRNSESFTIIESSKDDGMTFVPTIIDHDPNDSKDSSSGKAIPVDLKNSGFIKLKNLSNNEDSSSTSRLKSFHETMQRLTEAKHNLVEAFMRTRRDYLWGRPDDFRPSLDPSQLNNESFKHISTEVNQLINRKSRKTISAQEFKVLVEENRSMRNINPRGAYVHRLSEITTSIGNYDKLYSVHAANPWPQPAFDYILATWSYVESYIIKMIVNTFNMGIYICQRMMRVLSYHLLSHNNDQNHHHHHHVDGNEQIETGSTSIIVEQPPELFNSGDIKYCYHTFLTYIQPMKIALAIVLTSLLVIIPYLQDQQEYGIWAVIVITLIRQDNTSSSFLIGYQRLEGSVIGTVYAFTIFQAFQCGRSKNVCDISITLPILVAWLAVCAFFREGPRHGYSSLVAGFTPIVLFTGPVTINTEAAWSRVQKTFIGVAVYLIIDNVIYPNRTGTAIRSLVVKSVDETVGMFSQIIFAVKLLVDLGEAPSPHLTARLHLLHAVNKQIRDEYLQSSDQLSVKKSRSLTLTSTSPHLSPSTRSRRETITDLQSFIPRYSMKSARRDSDKYGIDVMNAYRQFTAEVDFIASSNGDAAMFESMQLTNAEQDNVKPLSYDDLTRDPFEHCDECLKSADRYINKLHNYLTQQSNHLAVVIHDPAIWQRQFPLDVYTTLLHCFHRLLNSGRGVRKGAAAFERVLQAMALHDENVRQQLQFYEFMSKRIFAVVTRTSAALRLTSEALHHLYEDHNLQTDLSPLITLSRYFDRLLQEVDHHFKDLFMSHDAPPVVMNPYFLLAWQNIFEALCDLVKSLSQLGTALHSVQSVEALYAT